MAEILAAGLCEGCVYRKTVTTRSGSRFVLCMRSFTDPDFPRYPRLPVLSCAGYATDSRGSLPPRPA